MAHVLKLGNEIAFPPALIEAVEVVASEIVESTVSFLAQFHPSL